MRPVRIAKPVLGALERRNVMEVLRSGQIASGDWVRRFEEKFSRYLGNVEGVATSSGTTALHAALLALGVGPRDKVVTTPFTFIASVNSIAFCGAEPVFCDVDPRTMLMDPTALEAVLQGTRAKVVLPVHLYGLPCETAKIVAIARRHGAKVLEDCAQSHGAKEHGRTTGSIGDAAAFSFYATKNLTTGEGGMVVSRKRGVIEAARKLINHGRRLQYEHDAIGYNYRMTNLAAAIGLAQLTRLPAMNRARRRNARMYDRALSGLSWLALPVVPKGRSHAYHLYTVRVARHRDAFVAHLKVAGIEAQVAYPTIVPEQPAYRGLGQKASSFPNALAASREVVSLPVHPSLSARDRARVIEAVKSFRIPG